MRKRVTGKLERWRVVMENNGSLFSEFNIDVKPNLSERGLVSTAIRCIRLEGSPKIPYVSMAGGFGLVNAILVNGGSLTIKRVNENANV